ncbi:MAG: hypothetical protein U9O18_01015 [Chloroflexota bacterium]|nr:hypothetical protein [Chloroflexota bacterium]
MLIPSLSLNGVELTAAHAEAVRAMFAAADGDMTEAEFTDWIETRSRAP